MLKTHITMANPEPKCWQTDAKKMQCCYCSSRSSWNGFNEFVCI